MRPKLNRDLVAPDGENRAVRTFLQLYGGTNSVTTGQMRQHLALSGFEDCWPDWTVQDMHLTKGGAQDWIRYLIKLEKEEAEAAGIAEELHVAICQAVSCLNDGREAQASHVLREVLSKYPVLPEGAKKDEDGG